MVYIHHIFFNYSSLDEHLGYFHVLMTVNSAAMNKGMHASFQIRVLSGYIPKSENAGSYGNFIFHFFKETSILFSTVAVRIDIPTNSVG